MAGETPITLIGHLVEEPNLRFTSSGQAVASFRLASTPRHLDKATNEWKDGETLFLTCSVWRRQAENLAESGLPKGTRLIVHGTLKQRSYETTDGQQRSVYEIDAQDVAVSVQFATVKATKAARQSSGQASAAVPAPDPWATTTAAQDFEPPF